MRKIVFSGKLKDVLNLTIIDVRIMKLRNEFIFWLIVPIGLLILSLYLVTSLGNITIDRSGYPTLNTINSASQSTCIGCHGEMEGLVPMHAQLACVTCHKGNNNAIEKDQSHAGMIKIPGNLSNAQEACGNCHQEAYDNIKSSMMTSNSGIIAIDKYIFGEFDSPDSLTHIRDIHHSPADEHLRSLCARCHIGAE
ncbi:MAG: hypothetical protein ABFS32_19900, partial [Bacteroidota bacterium]